MSLGRLHLFTLIGAHLLCTMLCTSQQVSPAVMEYPGVAPASKVDGHFDLTNDTLHPMFATIEAKSFTIGRDGKALFTAMKSDIHLELSATSVRIGPHQRRTIYYRVSGAAMPAWFCIYSNLSGLPRRSGMDVQLELPHTVYLYGKSEVRAEDLTLADVGQSNGHVFGKLTNHSANVVRVLAVDVSGDRLKKTDGGFPLLPGGERDFDIAIPQGKAAQTVRLRLAGLHVESIVP